MNTMRRRRGGGCEKKTNNKVASKTAANHQTANVYVYLIFSVLSAQVSLGLCAPPRQITAARINLATQRKNTQPPPTPHTHPTQTQREERRARRLFACSPQSRVSLKPLHLYWSCDVKTKHTKLAERRASARYFARSRTRRVSQQKGGGGKRFGPRSGTRAANQCVSVSAADRNCFCPEAFHMVTEANLSVLLRLNPPFLIANTALFESRWRGWAVR